MDLKNVHIFVHIHLPQGLRLARDLRDDFSVLHLANYLAYTLAFGGKIPFTLDDIGTLLNEADKACKLAKRYMGKTLFCPVSGPC